MPGRPRDAAIDTTDEVCKHMSVYSESTALSVAQFNSPTSQSGTLGNPCADPPSNR